MTNPTIISGGHRKTSSGRFFGLTYDDLEDVQATLKLAGCSSTLARMDFGDTDACASTPAATDQHILEVRDFVDDIGTLKDEVDTLPYVRERDVCGKMCKVKLPQATLSVSPRDQGHPGAGQLGSYPNLAGLVSRLLDLGSEFSKVTATTFPEHVAQGQKPTGDQASIFYYVGDVPMRRVIHAYLNGNSVGRPFVLTLEPNSLYFVTKDATGYNHLCRSSNRGKRVYKHATAHGEDPKSKTFLKAKPGDPPLTADDLVQFPLVDISQALASQALASQATSAEATTAASSSSFAFGSSPPPTNGATAAPASSSSFTFGGSPPPANGATAAPAPCSSFTFGSNTEPSI